MCGQEGFWKRRKTGRAEAGSVIEVEVARPETRESMNSTDDSSEEDSSKSGRFDDGIHEGRRSFFA